MYPFTYFRPHSLSEVEAYLATDEDARVLAGGMSLLPAMKLRLARPSTIVDLGDVKELKGISERNGSIFIGAMTRHADVARSALVLRTIPALSELAAGIGDRQVRNRGTIGGSVANCDPAACYPAAVLGLGALIRTNRRSIPADEFFIGFFETALKPGELIVAIEFPVPQASAYEKFHQPASRFALTGVFVAKTKLQLRVAVTGAGACVFRCSLLEEALLREFSQRSAEETIVDATKLNTDLHGDAEYRANLISVLAGRAVARLAATDVVRA